MCNSIQDFYWTDFDEMKAPPTIKKLGRAKTKHVTVQGVCQSCLKSEKKKAD